MVATTRRRQKGFSEGDNVIVKLGDRKMRAVIIMLGPDFGASENIVKVEDIDERIRDVYVENCTKVCSGCDGAGEKYYPAHQSAGRIVDSDEEVCRMCEGTGVLED